MSFKETNRYFISSLHARLRSLDPIQRQQVYQAEFKAPMRERIRQAYRACHDLSQRISFYEEILQVLAADELDWLLLSIFFEPEADLLLDALKETLEGIGAEKLAATILGSKSFLGQIPAYGGSRVKGYLKDFFHCMLDLSDREWREEDNNRNPLIYALGDYIIAHLDEKEGEFENLKLIILHFAKLWDIYYSQPFCSAKGSILFHKLISGYQQLDKARLKVNLLAVLHSLARQLTNLLPRLSEFPLRENQASDSQLRPEQRIGGEGYRLKKAEFFELLKADLPYFQDLSALSFGQLISACITADRAAEGAYVKVIEARIESAALPISSELTTIADYFADQQALSPALAQVLGRLIRENYIFR